MQKEKSNGETTSEPVRFTQLTQLAIVPGRAFTRRMYAKFSPVIQTPLFGKKLPLKEHKLETVPIKKGSSLKLHHHVNLDAEFRQDCQMWITFLESHRKGICCPFCDMEEKLNAEQLDFYSDAAKGAELGLGAVFGQQWLFAKWEASFIKQMDPSIEYLELLGICMGVFAWSERLRNRRIIMFCNNQAVVNMVNNTSSSCKNCMVLIRKLTLRSLNFNFRIFCHWVHGSENIRADFLSRQKIQEFLKLPGKKDQFPTELLEELWPVSKIWIN